MKQNLETPNKEKGTKDPHSPNTVIAIKTKQEDAKYMRVFVNMEDIGLFFGYLKENDLIIASSEDIAKIRVENSPEYWLGSKEYPYTLLRWAGVNLNLLDVVEQSIQSYLEERDIWKVGNQTSTVAVFNLPENRIYLVKGEISPLSNLNKKNIEKIINSWTKGEDPNLSEEEMKIIKEKGGKFTWNSDSKNLAYLIHHDVKNLKPFISPIGVCHYNEWSKKVSKFLFGEKSKEYCKIIKKWAEREREIISNIVIKSREGKAKISPEEYDAYVSIMHPFSIPYDHSIYINCDLSSVKNPNKAFFRPVYIDGIVNSGKIPRQSKYHNSFQLDILGGSEFQQRKGYTSWIVVKKPKEKRLIKG